VINSPVNIEEYFSKSKVLQLNFKLFMYEKKIAY